MNFLQKNVFFNIRELVGKNILNLELVNGLIKISKILKLLVKMNIFTILMLFQLIHAQASICRMLKNEKLKCIW